MTAVITERAGRRLWAGSFYVWMAVAFVLTAFAGFLPTYWQPLAAGKFSANPVVHIHGLVFFSWTLFFLFQTSLVAGGQSVRHREIGLAGVALATLMTVLGVLVALNSLRTAMAQGAAAQGEAFCILPLGDIVPFAILVGLAVANTRRPEIHKRFMLLAMIGILDAPIARPLLTWVFPNVPPGPPPAWIEYPAATIADLFLVAAIAYDWRKLGRPHPVYLWGGAALVASQFLRVPISDTAAWHSLMRDFAGLAGAFPARPG
jgi:hypothetical protein